MNNKILKYQGAFNNVVKKMKNNDSILAVMVFGSIITGDLWKESDIDLFVISKDSNIEGLRNIYTEEEEVPVHVKLMSKERFLNIHEEDLIGGFIHRIFASSRLVFSRDEEVTLKYDMGRYYPDVEREKWSMVYLGNLLKNMSVCEKYLNVRSLHMAYSEAVKCVEDFSKLYVNSSGYMISKDVIVVAMNLDDKLKELIDNLFFNKTNIENSIQELIDYLHLNIEGNFKSYTSILLNYMAKKDCLLSAEEIKKDEFFINYKIDFEGILNKLWQKQIIKRQIRDFKSKNNEPLFKEKVYTI